MEMSSNFDKEKSELYCSTVAKSISNIIRYSLDEEFRSESFKIFQTQSTNETEAKVYENLIQILENRKNNITDDIGNQNENIEKSDKDSETNSTSTSQETSTPSTSTQESGDSQSLFSTENFYKRNWFKISSEKYKENFKKRKIQYFSQPTTFSTQKTEIFKNFNQTPDFSTHNWDCSFTNSFSQSSFKNSQEYEDNIQF